MNIDILSEILPNDEVGTTLVTSIFVNPSAKSSMLTLIRLPVTCLLIRVLLGLKINKRNIEKNRGAQALRALYPSHKVRRGGISPSCVRLHFRNFGYGRTDGRTDGRTEGHEKKKQC